jgi:hypothetical protein
LTQVQPTESPGYRTSAAAHSLTLGLNTNPPLTAPPYTMNIDLCDFVHYRESTWSTSEPWIPTFEVLPIDEWGDKPYGDVRWFAVENAWLDYCEGSGFNLGKYKYKYRIVLVLVDKPICVIDTRESAARLRTNTDQKHRMTIAIRCQLTGTELHRTTPLFT